ncbi:MAG TPA: hypothetical protein VIM42_09195 [Clostridium sp.]
MSKETDTTLLLEAVKFLEMATDSYSRIPHVAIMRIKSIIEELEDIIKEVG